MKQPKHALIDGDILRYQLGAVLSKGDTITIGGKQIDIPQKEAQVYKYVEDTIRHILDATAVDTFTVYLSEGKNFRFGFATTQPYKGNRKDFVKPYHWATVGRVLREKYQVITCTLFEADDHLAKDQKDDGSTVICSRDKDLKGRSGWHYSWGAGERNPEVELHWINEIEAARWFYTQCLTGDSTDNIIGCGIKKPDKKGNPRRNGVGPKAAEKLLMSASSEEEMFAIVSNEYLRVFGSEWQRHLEENGTLLYMSKELTPWKELDKVKKLFEEYNASNQE